MRNSEEEVEPLIRSMWRGAPATPTARPAEPVAGLSAKDHALGLDSVG